MRITLLHPPHTATGSRIPDENLPPFGLLCLGGPLIDDGHEVSLVNADLGPLSLDQALSRVVAHRPEAILIGHSGSTSAHPTVALWMRDLRRRLPDARIIYGGVFPTYHWREVLEECPEVDFIVRGEGEETIRRLVRAFDTPETVPGIAYRKVGEPVATRPAAMIRDLDAYRIGWELIDFDAHSYWGGRKAVIMQFSRGCPHQCTYCGQRGFWTRWRHRDPVKFAHEIAWLHREHGVELINLADENPTTSPKAWRALLDELIALDLPIKIIGSTRADDIVRDKAILPLYHKAGLLRFLLGLEGTSETTLEAVRKGGTRSKDQQAIQLLRANGIIGLCTFAVGFAEEHDRDYWQLLRQLRRYDPDQIMSIYATPHKWTPFYRQSADRRVIDPDLRHWDYKHQVMEVAKVPPWRVFLWVKCIELALQARPKALWRSYLHPDPEIRHAMRWYTRMGRRVFLREVGEALRRRLRPGPRVSTFLGAPVAEQALQKRLAPAISKKERA